MAVQVLHAVVAEPVFPVARLDLHLDSAGALELEELVGIPHDEEGPSLGMRRPFLEKDLDVAEVHAGKRGGPAPPGEARGEAKLVDVVVDGLLDVADDEPGVMPLTEDLGTFGCGHATTFASSP
jgi:hypothetical protein